MAEPGIEPVKGGATLARYEHEASTQVANFLDQ